MRIKWIDCTPEIAEKLDIWLCHACVEVENIKKYAMFDGTFSEELEYYSSGQNQFEGRIADYIKVVYIDDILIAYLMLGYYTYDDICEISINPMVVNPDFQGKGYGKWILRDLVARCEEIIGAKVDRIDAGIDEDNRASKRLFEGAGFEVYGGAGDGKFFYYRKEM